MLYGGNPVVHGFDGVDDGGDFDAMSSARVEQRGVALSDLGAAVTGSGAFTTLAYGPMLLLGPAFYVVPMIGSEGIARSPTPIRILGVGTLTIDREAQVAGPPCAVVRTD